MVSDGASLENNKPPQARRDMFTLPIKDERVRDGCLFERRMTALKFEDR
jgi:hypothetical protein